MNIHILLSVHPPSIEESRGERVSHVKVIGMLIISLWVDIAEICQTKGVPDSISTHNLRRHLQPRSKRLGTLEEIRHKNVPC